MKDQANQESHWDSDRGIKRQGIQLIETLTGLIDLGLDRLIE